MHRSYPCFLPPTQNRDMKINGSGEKLTLHTLEKKHSWSSSLILFPPANFHITFIIICGYHGKGKWISKGLFAVFVCTKNERKYFSFLPWKKILSWVQPHSRISFFSEIWSYMGFFRYSDTFSMFKFNIRRIFFIL